MQLNRDRANVFFTLYKRNPNQCSRKNTSMRKSLHTWLLSVTRQPLVMGILNVTPDSFSDGGQFGSIEEAVKKGLEMVTAGAAVVDVGGESTRPGAQPVDAQEQIRRTIPVIQGIRAQSEVWISIDTTRAEVAEAALAAGADIINDVSGGTDDAAMLNLAAASQAAIVLMHMQGRPGTMQVQPHYDDVVGEVSRFLAHQTAAGMAAGLKREAMILDAGIGFGKTTEHNLMLLNNLRHLRGDGRQALLVGSSRKRFIGEITGEPLASHRLMGTAATVAWAIANGSDMVRVHDVAEMVQVVKMIQAIGQA